jgi:hypothetical protein
LKEFIFFPHQVLLETFNLKYFPQISTYHGAAEKSRRTINWGASSVGRAAD